MQGVLSVRSILLKVQAELVHRGQGIEVFFELLVLVFYYNTTLN